MSGDPIRQAIAAKHGIVRYTLPLLFEPEPVDVDGLTPGTGPARPASTASQAFDRLLHDHRAGSYGT